MKFRKLKRTLISSIKWNFVKINVVLMRRKLERSNFYEDVVFANSTVKNQVQKNVAKWMINLKRIKQIEIKRFVDLFSNLDEIKFPIKIEGSFMNKLYLDITDSMENKYYMYNKGTFDYYNITKYFIGNRNTKLDQLIDRELCYEICEDGLINLTKTTVVKLNQDGSNSDCICEIDYSYKNKTGEIIVSLCETDRKITVKYPMSSAEVNNEIFQYLFENIEKNWNYYDVFPVFKVLANKISRDDVSIYVVAEINNEVFSEVEVVNNIVHKYTFTKILNEGEMHVIKKIFAKKLEEFLKDDINM